MNQAGAGNEPGVFGICNGNPNLAGKLTTHGFMGTCWFHVNQFSIGKFVAGIIALLGNELINSEGLRGGVGHGTGFK
ncbi:hypothetical protein DO97_21615 [Neosynechococcus sphagnicola sy1]|uniref:Uncharacterized protein n=1 Tax=Neosynechococcus sphagnicola sy1 TaxID=1497020 RepID=A0A098TH02_9CYAN|nr:hypothetical protein DO97_21615 [Neosynechococcus sphagnicola sy1]